MDLSKREWVWVLTGSGRVVDLMCPDPDLISIEDIARQLSRLARFNGATRGHNIYSVAQHSVFVSHIAQMLSDDPLAPRYGLLHDAHETYIGDLTTPVKILLGADGLARLVEVEVALDAAICEHFGLPPISHELALLVKQADMIALATERRELMPQDGPDWQLGVEPMLASMGDPLPMELAYARFMDRFMELTTDLSPQGVELRHRCRQARAEAGEVRYD